MAGGKRRYKRNPTAGGPRHSAGAGRRRSLPELPSFVSPTSVAAAFGPSSSGGRGRNRARRAAAEPANAVPFSYTAALRPCPASAGGATQALEVAIDTASCADPAASASMYSYEVVGGIGLGFHGDEEEEAGESAPHLGLGFHDPIKEEEMDVEAEELEEVSFVTPRQAKGKGRQNGGYISIGGVRDHNADVYSDEEDSDDDKGDPESDEDGSGSDSEEGLSIGDSSVDDEIVADYMEGIGGSEELLSSRWLNGMKLVDSDDDEMDTDDDEDGFLKKGKEKLEGYALMRASEQYGMKRPNSAERRKGKSTSGRDCDRGLASIQVTGMEDVMMVKDVRMANRSGKGAKASSSSQLSRSWPDAAGKSKKYQRVPGEKKKQKKEHIAKKRRQRMLSRGVDLEQINTKLRKMVVNQLDMLCFQPMHSRDCSQTVINLHYQAIRGKLDQTLTHWYNLASIYQLKSGCQGSGNKRFVMVTLTGQSSMPSADGQVRLDKLLGTEPEDYSVNWNSSKGPARAKGLSAPGKLARHSDSCGKKVPKKQVTFAERPVSFVSSGTMVETVTEAVAVGSTAGDVSSEKVVGSDSKLGTFETHTKGFGSKMMAKMGFIEGTGLGKDGQGILQPVQAIQRPKSLGLGVEFDSELEAAKSRSEPPANPRRELGRSRSEPRRNTRPPEMYDCGTFERHTKGFGSKMMVKMGFVPGSGLGKDGQGIVNPLTVVRRPKSRGLGATDKY
ncbi:hypothetical protein ZWY2020_059298 [Hordeum vulgare]|nr:hypothetical protein ZWY2020_059298 [Hordeum vulgare]